MFGREGFCRVSPSGCRNFLSEKEMVAGLDAPLLSRWKLGVDVREVGGLCTQLAGAALLVAGGEVARLIADDHTLPLGNNADFAVGSVECAINRRITDQVLVGQLPPDGLE